MNQIELSAGTIEYEDTGGEGPTLVLLHGFLMDASLWDDVIAELFIDHRCVVPTLPLRAHRHAMHADAGPTPARGRNRRTPHARHGRVPACDRPVLVAAVSEHVMPLDHGRRPAELLPQGRLIDVPDSYTRFTLHDGLSEALMGRALSTDWGATELSHGVRPDRGRSGCRPTRWWTSNSYPKPHHATGRSYHAPSRAPSSPSSRRSTAPRQARGGDCGAQFVAGAADDDAAAQLLGHELEAAEKLDSGEVLIVHWAVRPASGPRRRVWPVGHRARRRFRFDACDEAAERAEGRERGGVVAARNVSSNDTPTTPSHGVRVRRI